MKILSFGDIHARSENPRSRIGDYCDILFDKIEYGLVLGGAEGCEYVAMPGDIFQTHRASNYVISRLIKLIKKYNHLKFVGVIGNHDAPFHNLNLDNCPINVLESSEALTVLNDKPLKDNCVHFYGASWGESIPDIQDHTAFNVLLIHKMIIKSEDEKIWHGQSSYITSRGMLAKNNFNLIIAGDNHQTILEEYNGKTLLNMGSLGRMTSSQTKFTPSVAIFDTDKNEYIIYKIPIKPAKEVFNLEQIEKNRETGEINDKIREYVDLLGGNSEMREWDFVKNLDEFIKKHSVKQEVQDIIKLTL